MIAAAIKKSALLFLCLNSLCFSVPRIHIFGDSHAYHCFSDHYNNEYVFHYNDLSMPLSVHHFDSKTMYSIGRDRLGGMSIQKYGVKEREVALFVFGEIDVRCHIGKQRDMHNRSLEAIITDLVANYIRTVTQNRALYKKLTCIVMEVMPPTDQVASNPYYPRYGTIEERVSITKALNKQLKSVCHEHGVLFFEIHDICAEDNGILKAAVSDGNVHISMDYNYLIKQKLISFLQEKLG